MRRIQCIQSIRSIQSIRFRLVIAAAFAVVSGGAIALLGAAPAGAATVALSVHDFAFSPTPLTITAGTTVTVTNSGAATHTWTSDPGDPKQWNSGNVAPGASFSVTFPTAGTYSYHCNIHPFMTGTIVVTAATPATTAPPVTTPATAPPNTSPVATTPVTVAAGAAAGATTPPNASRATALPRTGAAHSRLLAEAAATLVLTGIALAVSGVRRRRRIS